MKSVLFAAALLIPGVALAQSAAPDLKTFSTSAEVTALVAAAKAERKDEVVISKPILSLAPYRAAMEYRAIPGAGAVHETEAELIYVIDGSGTLTMGGKLKDEKRTNAANLSGSGIDGATPRRFTKGDFAFVPQNTPHQMIPDAGSALVLMTLHVPRPVPGQ